MPLTNKSSVLEKKILNGSGPLSQSFADSVVQSPFTAAALGGAICGAGYQLLTSDRSDPKFYDRMLQRTVGGAIFVIGIYALSPEFLKGKTKNRFLLVASFEITVAILTCCFF